MFWVCFKLFLSKDRELGGSSDKRGKFRKAKSSLYGELYLTFWATPPLQQIPEKEPTGSDATSSATTGAAEDNEPVTEEKPKTPDPENQQETVEHETEAAGNDTEQEVINK